MPLSYLTHAAQPTANKEEEKMNFEGTGGR